MAEPRSTQPTALEADPVFERPGICHACIHRVQGTFSCAAFPAGIPDVVLAGYFDHRDPFPGDQGITFELDPDADRD